jgi:hypothetical protein
MLFSFKSIIITFSLIHTKNTQSISFHSPTWWKIRNNYQRKLTTQLSVDNFRRFCITMWQIVHIFRQKSKHVLSTVRKDSVYQFLCTATQSKFWEKLTTWLSVDIFKRFCITVWQTVYILRQKSKCPQKVSSELKKNPEYQFYLKLHA